MAKALAYLDTHLLVWLFEGRRELLTPSIEALLEERDLVISPMVELELQYLYEIGKCSVDAAAIVRDLYDRIGLQVSDSSFRSVIAGALQETWTRDPFDRLIVSEARLEDAHLITKDRLIRRHYKKAFWQ